MTEVRDFLNKLSEQRVPDDTIAMQIKVATAKIDNEKSASVSADKIEEAKLVYAGFLVYLAYVTEYERSAGTVPGFIIGHLDTLRELANNYLEYVKRGTPVPIPLISQPATLQKQYTEGELEGDVY